MSIWLDRNPVNIPPIAVTATVISNTASTLLQPIYERITKQTKGTTLAHIVETLRAVVVVMVFLALNLSRVTLRTMLNTHMVRNGIEVRSAFSAILNLRTCFMNRGSSIRTMYQPQLEQTCATNIAQKGDEVRIDFQGTGGFCNKSLFFCYTISIVNIVALPVLPFVLGCYRSQNWGRSWCSPVLLGWLTRLCGGSRMQRSTIVVAKWPTQILQCRKLLPNQICQRLFPRWKEKSETKTWV